VGTGISDLVNEAHQFLDKFPSVHPSIGQLTDEDMPDVLDHFIPDGKADSQRDLKTNAMNELLVATSGQLYPFVVPAKHLLEPETAVHLTNVSAYLTSKTFYYSDDYINVQCAKRCYGLSKSKVELLARFLLEQPRGSKDTEYAATTGLWTATSFVSPLLVQEVF
jgi:hypothetical protein